MSRTIHKYPLDWTGRSLMLSDGAEFLAVQQQGAQTQAWFAVDPSLPRDRLWRYRVMATGEELPDDCTVSRYAGTVQTGGGAGVWHVFLWKEKP